MWLKLVKGKEQVWYFEVDSAITYQRLIRREETGWKEVEGELLNINTSKRPQIRIDFYQPGKDKTSVVFTNDKAILMDGYDSIIDKIQ